MGLKEEGLRAFGAWEPLAHRIRGRTDIRHEDRYAWEHTEEFIKGLKDRGLNLFITHFSKGYGIQAEGEERENTRRIAELCHKHGMYVGGYMRYTNFVPETLKHEVPDCVERFGAVTPDGSIPKYRSTQYWRYMPCPTSTDWLDYLDRLIEIGMDDIGLDCLHVDGLSIRAACHCARCAEQFREWLARRYPAAEARKARFGFADFDHVSPPDVHVSMQLPNPIINDPLLQEWLLFGHSLLGKVWKFIVEAAHRRKPECLVQGNSAFSPNSRVAHISELAKAGSYGLFTEEGNAPNLTRDGRLHGYFETFKKLRGLGFQVFTYNREPRECAHGPMTEPERLKRGMAHQMAFNLDSAGVFCAQINPGEWPVTVPEYMAFHRDRRDLFRNTRQAHDVAIYYSERTRALNCGTPIATSLLARDAMMRGHVPFGYLLADRRGELNEFRAVVLPEVECMAAREAADLAAYVRNGGGLLVIGRNTGCYDELRHPHKKNVLMAELGVEWREGALSTRVGSGRVAFLPQLVTPEGAPEELVRDSEEKSKPYFRIVNDEWHLPLNAADMLNLLGWAADGFRFELTVPDSVVVEFARQDVPRRHLVHLVNFDLDHDVGPFEILCRGLSPATAAAASPDGPAPEVKLCPGPDSSCKIVCVKGFRRYLIISIG